MAFMRDDQEPSITSETAPFIPAVDYDSDVELFQVPIKRGASPFKVPEQDAIPVAALRYAAPPALSEESLSTNSQPTPDSRDTSPHKKLCPSSPPSSVGGSEHDGDMQDQKPKHSNASSTQKSKILQATQLHLTKGKAKPVQTKRPKKLVLPLKAHLYELEESDDDEDFSTIHKWLEQCHVVVQSDTGTDQKSKDNASGGRANIIAAGSQLLHPFLGPVLFSPPMMGSASFMEPKVYAINIHGTLAHHTNTNTSTKQKGPSRPSLTRQNANLNLKSPTNRQVEQNIFTPKLEHQEEHEETGLSDRNSNHISTTDSAYDRAREMEIHLSEHLALSRPDIQLKGKSHWFIDANLSEASHFRLARVATCSAEGFDALRRHHLEGAGLLYLGADVQIGTSTENENGEDSFTWGPGGVFAPPADTISGAVVREEQQQQHLVESQTAAELAELYRALAAVHVVFGEEMRSERARGRLAGTLPTSGQQLEEGLERPELEENKLDGERGRGRYRDRYHAGARERESRQQERKRDLGRFGDEPGVVRRSSMGSKIGSLRGRRRRRVTLVS